MLQTEGLIRELKLDWIISELYVLANRPYSYQAIIKPFDIPDLVYIDIDWRALVSAPGPDGQRRYLTRLIRSKLEEILDELARIEKALE